jgi:hypothetical protein
MNAASRSVYFFGFYLLLTGVTLTVFPNLLLTLVQIPETTEVWIRILGTVVFALGVYYVFMAPTNNALFMKLTVYLRWSIFMWFMIFVVIGYAPMQLLLFGAIDLAGAVWTYTAMKKG